MEDKGVTNFVQTTSNIFSLFFNSNKLSFRMNDKTRVGFLLEDEKIMAETAREKLLRRRIFFQQMLILKSTNCRREYQRRKECVLPCHAYNGQDLGQVGTGVVADGQDEFN